MNKTVTILTIPALLALGACDGGVTDPPTGSNPEEVITTIELTFTPDGGGAAETFVWADPEDDGDPVIDDILLTDGMTYSLDVTFLNELENPAEDITAEVADEDDEHQVFLLGSAVDGPANDNASALVEHAYDDTDADGNPVGLSNTITAIAAGTGDFQLVLRHLPPENDTPTKVPDLAADVATGGIGSIAGDSDVDVTFPLEVGPDVQ